VPLRTHWRRGYARSMLLFVVVSALTAVASWPFVARANNIKAQFPSANGGVLWMSQRESYLGLIYITSNHCNSGETTAYSNIKSSTTGKAQMTRWSSGIDMSNYRCDGVWDNYADIRINYKDQSYFLQPDGHYIGGRNVDVAASSAYCAFWNTYSPCGSRPTVEINTQKFFSNSLSYEESEIEHETGHSFGLAHHCTGYAVMNNGASGCPDGYAGHFGSAPGYYATDRQGIDNVYP
jgi:hypothetical protein